MIKKDVVMLLAWFAFWLVRGAVVAGAGPEDPEFREDLARIQAMKDSFVPGRPEDFASVDEFIQAAANHDLAAYEQFSEEILTRWHASNPELFARLTIALCAPLTSGSFKEDRRFDVARQYALTALKQRDAIPLELELELALRVTAVPGTYYRPTPPDYAEHRRQALEVRLRAWKRLLDAVDPTWDPNDVPFLNVPPPFPDSLPSGLSREAAAQMLQAQHEAAIELNRQKTQRYNAQYSVRRWLKGYPRIAEQYIIPAYSTPPFNTHQLQQALDVYIADHETRQRITKKVQDNIDTYQRLVKRAPVSN